MATNQFNIEDYLEVARSRTTQQFILEGAPVFDKYLQLLIQGFQEVQFVFEDLMTLRSVHTAKGAQLDIIGNIVGQDRELISADLYDFFGMQGALGANPMGDSNTPSVGGMFYSYGLDLGGNIELDDETYRLFIKAKIYKNNTSSTPEELIQSIKMIFSADQVYLSETGNANALVFIGKELTNLQKVFLTYISNSAGYPSRLIPKTIGVGLKFGQFESNNYFGFQDSIGAKGFGNGTSPSDGGKFATIY